MQTKLSREKATQVALDILVELDTGDAKANEYIAAAIVRLRMVLRGGKRKYHVAGQR